MSTEPELLLRRLAAADERCLGGLMAPTPEFRQGDPSAAQALDRRTRTLVRLAALLAVGAPTVSVQWAVELASVTAPTSTH